MISFRDAGPADFETIIEINEIEVKQTSPLSFQRLRELDELACYHKLAILDGKIAAFLLAVCHGADYQNDNYAWFAARYLRFLYIDRIVVSKDCLGMKAGSLLYQHLFRYADEKKLPIICCEYNIEPLNLASQAFHDKLGFVELGQRQVMVNKRVSMQSKRL